VDIKNIINNFKIDLTSIRDENLRGNFVLLLNVVEHVSKENDSLRKTNQELADEINRLKGEQGKPNVRPQKKDKKNKNTNHSSEKERKGTEDKKKDPKGETKNERIKIDRTERCRINRDTLPSDAVFKGCEKVIIQDLTITTNNVEFERETYYSASTGTTYIAPLPPGYRGQYGPSLKSLVLSLYQDGGMTQPAILRFLETHGIIISSGTISSIITDVIDPFHQEKSDIVDAGLDATNYHNLDDTGSKVNGKNHHTHILCSPYFTAYFTLPRRDRLAVIEVLSNGNLRFCINERTYELMAEMGLVEKRLEAFKALNPPTDPMTRAEIDAVIASIFPDANKQKTNQKRIREAAAIIAYQEYCGKTQMLITDGAPQFQGITEYHGYCWVHEARHYKKLKPVLPLHREILESFLKKLWTYYRCLLYYKKSPSAKKAEFLSKVFDSLFSKKTGYQDLDNRIAITLSNKVGLLQVLQFPHIPLHNNAAESGARIQARKRDISLQTKNAKGTKAKDTLMTIVETAKKLGVNIYQYIYDRLSEKYEMTSLADLIRQKASIPAIA
jgi:hypothetical protein